MSRPADHERFEDDLAAWALGALEPDEARAFERHLARCEQCRADLNWLRPAVDALPASVTQIAPPPRLRGELLATVRTEARHAKRGRWTSSRLPFGIPRPAAAALGAAALVGAGVAGYALHGAPDGDTMAMDASGPAHSATAELVVDGNAATLRCEDMPALHGGRVYQAWLARPGSAPVPSTVFVPGRHGDASATIEGVKGADEVLVTREPPGGSDEPTTVPVLTAAL